MCVVFDQTISKTVLIIHGKNIPDSLFLSSPDYASKPIPSHGSDPPAGEGKGPADTNFPPHFEQHITTIQDAELSFILNHFYVEFMLSVSFVHIESPQTTRRRKGSSENHLLLR